ncbi:MAG: TolC family protein [Rhodospirillaceae bacterium]
MHCSRRGRASAPVKAIALVTATLFIAGCSGIQPLPVTHDELRATATADRAKAQSEIEPVKGKITLEEAIARALKYNLERRSRMMEEAIALNQLDVSQYDMLPRLLAQAGYRWRDKELITRSRDSVTGQPALSNPFISTERSHVLYDMGLTWNLLDFGASYYGAKQNANRVLIALERRRKAMHVLIQDVRTAFWRTASAQKLQKQVQDAIVLAEDALKDARKAEAERVRSPVESLRYQRQVLENLRLLESTNQELTTARLELAHLMNVPLAFNLEVAEPTETVSRKMLDVPVEKLEEIAVGRNAELREHFYNARIAGDETRKVILRLFPGVSFNYNTKYDTDNFLVNRHWNEAGASISFNLFNLLSGPSQKRLADAGVALADQRRMAMQMAILAQVHIARLQYANALNQYERAQDVADVDQRIVEIMAKREQAQVQSKLETVANRTTAILSLLRRYQALSQAHAAASRLQATLGVEPEFDSVQDLSLAQLKDIVSKALAGWENGDLPTSGEPLKSGDATPKAAAATVTRASEPPQPTKAVTVGASAAPTTKAAVSGSSRPIDPSSDVAAAAPALQAAQPPVESLSAAPKPAMGSEDSPEKTHRTESAGVKTTQDRSEAPEQPEQTGAVAAAPAPANGEVPAASLKGLVFRVGESAGPGRQMYKWVDEHGVVHYDERPLAGYMSMVVTVKNFPLPEKLTDASVSTR